MYISQDSFPFPVVNQVRKFRIKQSTDLLYFSLTTVHTSAQPFQHLLLPYSLPKERKKSKGEKQDETTNKRTPGKSTTPRHVLEMPPLRPLPYKCPSGGPAPPSPPYTSSLSPSEPSSLSSFSSRGRIVRTEQLLLLQRSIVYKAEMACNTLVVYA